MVILERLRKPGTAAWAAGISLLLVVATVGYLFASLSYSPLAADQDISVDAGGAARQAGRLVGRVVPGPGGDDLHLVFGPGAMANGSVSLTVTFVTPVPAETRVDLGSIQGNLQMDSAWMTPETLSLSFYGMAAESYPSALIVLPAGTVTPPPLIGAFYALSGASLSAWLAVTATLLLAILLIRLGYLRAQKARLSAKGARRSYPPEGIGPIEAAILTEGTLLPRHVSALVLDLAERGYLKVVSNDHGVFFIRTEKPEPLRNYEEMVLQLLAPRHQAPQTVQETLAAMDADIFSAVVSGIYVETYRSLTEAGFFAENLRLLHLRYKTAGILIEMVAAATIALASLVPVSALAGPAVFGTGLFCAGWIVYLTGYHVIAATPLGAEFSRQTLAFRAHLESPSAATSEEGLELFPYLAYAVAFGCADAWLAAHGTRARYLPDWLSVSGQPADSASELTGQLLLITEPLAVMFVHKKDPNVD